MGNELSIMTDGSEEDDKRTFERAMIREEEEGVVRPPGGN
jgi:hypothetical protein